MHIIEYNPKSNSNEKSLAYNVKVGRVARGNYTYNVTVATEGYTHKEVIKKLEDMINHLEQKYPNDIDKAARDKMDKEQVDQYLKDIDHIHYLQ